MQRTKSSRSQPRHPARAHRPQHLAQGTWRNRVRHRPDPGGGAGGGRSAQTAPLILLVDDERAIRTICRVNLEADGLAVVEAKDGTEALQEIKRERPSLVLLDVMMPGIDGWSVAEQLAADAETREIPVVFVSARAAREDRLRAQELGAVGYIVKPFDPLVLAGFVREVLERVAQGEREQLNRELADEG
ncbi:MAG TPA: F420-dependent methylenetetrahydromethanopterin dehydrogenase [Gaiellaceae bacterium]|nr:F420-dependent methylenetetrahydromethanopterin dehydrogenase [Gaiellaceae bacterium]